MSGTLTRMSAPAPATGELSESAAISEMASIRQKHAAAEAASQSERGRRPDREDDEAQPEADLEDPTDEDAPPQEDEEPPVEGDEFGEGEEQAAPSGFGDNTRVKFEDGTEVTVHELKRGFLRERDYTHKTQEVATQRKAFEAERTQYAAQQKQVAERLTPLIQSTIDWIQGQDQRELADLKATDPGAWSARMLEIEQKRQNGLTLMREQQALVEASEREELQRTQQARSAAVAASRDALRKEIPAAKKDFDGWYQKVGNYVLESGVSPELWNEVIDHPVVTLAWKAMQYDAAVRKSPQTKDRLAALPPTVKSGARVPQSTVRTDAVKRADQALAKSHSIEDAVRAMSARREASQQRPSRR